MFLWFSHHHLGPSALGIDAGGLQPLGVIPTVRLRDPESLGSTGTPQTLCCPHSYSDQSNTGSLLSSLEKKRCKLHCDEVQHLLTKSGGTRARLIEVLIV